MMFLQNPQIEDFINANLNTDLHSLLLKKSPFSEVSMQEIVQQIRGRKIAQKKFPALLKNGIVFPLNINLEQTSSQSTAEYKAQNLAGKSFADLTCGFGIDAYFLSKNFENISLVEQNTELIKIVEHNWQILGRKAEFHNQTLQDFLEQNHQKFDVLYIDPARRDNNKNKVFLLEDLSPNLLEIKNKIYSKASEIIIKLSPLIDLKYLISILDDISRIEILAVKNEVKEILVVIHPEKKSEKILCKSVNLETSDPIFNFYFDEKEEKITYSEPETFIYLPNNAILKSGAFGLVAERFSLKKLAANTHIYTFSQKIMDFPGRVLEMQVVDSKDIKKGEQYNIISKNHPLTPEQIKKKYKLKDGGNAYLIFTQTEKQKIILKTK